jgi:hypothetical protein
VAQSRPIWFPKEEGEEKQTKKANENGKGKGKGPRYRDRTISGHDLPHTEMRDGGVALSGAENGSEGLGKVVGFFSLWKAFVDKGDT